MAEQRDAADSRTSLSILESRFREPLIANVRQNMTMSVQQFATHYYLRENGPFRSLSDLPAGSEDPIFLDLLTRHKRELGYRRRYGKDYIRIRRRVEDQLRELFIARGGNPRRRHPFYLVYGESAWFRDLNANQDEVRIPLSDLDPETTSLTFPDSFIALSRNDKPYYNQVFLLGELSELVERFGVPANDHLVPYERYWETDFELYIEIQLWDTPPKFPNAEQRDAADSR